MSEEFGTKPEDCLVGIAPSIGPCCYEVGEEVVGECESSFPNNFGEIVIRRDGKIYIDLWQANKIQLLEEGFPEENIDVAKECTRCQSGWYFSYRAASPENQNSTGRIAALISLRG